MSYILIWFWTPTHGSIRWEDQNYKLYVCVPRQVSGAHSVLLSETKRWRKGGFTQHCLLRLAWVLIWLQGHLEEGKQSYSQGTVRCLTPRGLLLSQPFRHPHEYFIFNRPTTALHLLNFHPLQRTCMSHILRLHWANFFSPFQLLKYCLRYCFMSFHMTQICLLNVQIWRFMNSYNSIKSPHENFFSLAFCLPHLHHWRHPSFHSSVLYFEFFSLFKYFIV